VTAHSDGAAQFTAVTTRTVEQAQQVAANAVAQLDAGHFGCEAWCQSLLTLFNIMAQGAAAQLQTVVSQPCCGPSPCGCGGVPNTGPLTCGMAPSDPISVQADPVFPRQLSVAVPFTRVGAPHETLPPGAIQFQPNTLPAGATSFAVYLTEARYIGKSYTGTVLVSGGTGPALYKPFTVEL
jgi:hypothetical protein